MLEIKGAIFDVDGTMLDSIDIWERMTSDYLISLGVTPDPDLYANLLALGGHEIPGYLRTAYGLRKSADEIQRGIYGVLEEFYFYKAQPKKGVIAVLNALRDRGVEMCVATATDRRLIEPALKRCGLSDFFGRAFTCSEEMTSKRSPDIYYRAASHLGTAIADTLVVEDAPYAVKTAKSAGFQVVAVYDQAAHDEQENVKKLSDYYFISMDEMLPLLVP